MRRLKQSGPIFCFFILAYFLAPFTFGGKSVLVTPGVGLDAIQNSLLLADGMDKLLTKPRSYYDTAILYPDKNQLRGTEPFLGSALLGLPLRTILHLNDADVFEVLRWLLILTSLIYAYLLFRAIGVGGAVSVTGAVLCWSQRGLLYGIERLQVVSIPLILAVIYHGLMVWRSSRPRLGHSVGLFVFSALYPLLGVINATIAALAGLLVLPWLLEGLVTAHRQRRLAACVVPIFLAAVFDAAVLAPWLLDRADLEPYVSDAFLQIKHWNPTNLPARLHDIPRYVDGLVGPGMVAALFVIVVSGARARKDDASRKMSEKYLAPLLASVSAVVAASMFHAGELVLRWSGVLFQIVCWATLVFYWRDQARWSAADAHGIDRAAVMLSAGLGVFLCLMSFGPLYTSNTSPLANGIMRVLLEVLPPLKSIREFVRIWIFGALFLSMYATVRLGVALRGHGPLMRTGVAVIVVLAAMSSLVDRRLVATGDIEAPGDFVQLASHSRRTGAIYVHPDMKWNSKSGVFMIAIAKELGRPIVNGYLGIMPPWFGYASNVLHRFPDPEALWLLRRWNVHTVVSVAGDVVGRQSDLVDRVVEDRGVVVWDLAARAQDLQHPSEEGGLASEGHARVEGAWFGAEHVAVGAVVVKVPARFQTTAIEIHFGPSVVEQIPDEIGVYAFDGARGVRANEGHAGEWIESLAADALLRRKSPVATIRVIRTPTREFLVECRKSENTPIERIVLVGEWRD